MLVVILLAAAAILAGVVAVAMGRGGELARNQTERPRHTGFRTAGDVASYRPPPALLGYQAAATEHALALIARAIAERDAEIDWLRERLQEAQATVMRDAGAAGAVAGRAPLANAGPGADAGYADAGYADGGYADAGYADGGPAGRAGTPARPVQPDGASG